VHLQRDLLQDGELADALDQLGNVEFVRQFLLGFLEHLLSAFDLPHFLLLGDAVSEAAEELGHEQLLELVSERHALDQFFADAHEFVGVHARAFQTLRESAENAPSSSRGILFF